MILIDTDVVLGSAAIAAIGVAVLGQDLLTFTREVKLYPAPSLLQRILGQFGLDAKKRGLAAHLPWKRAIRSNVIKQRDGSYLAMWRIAGTDVGALSDEDVVNTAYAIGATIGAQLPSTKIQLYLRSAPFREYLSGLGWSHPIALLADKLRAKFFLEKARVFFTERTMTFTYQPPPEWQEKMLAAVSVGADAQLKTENDLLLEYQGMCDTLEAAFNNGRTLTATRLGVRKALDATGAERTVSDIISFCYLVLTGFNTALVAPPPGVDIHDYLAVETRGGYEPRVGELEVSAVSLTTLPSEAVPRMLAKLGEMKVSHIMQFSFVPEVVADAAAALGRGVSNFKAAANFSAKRYVDPGYAAKQAEMLSALGKTTDDYTRPGLMSMTILTRARSRRDVRKSERAIQAVLGDCHFRGTVRRMGALDTVLSTLPGNIEIRRKREFRQDALVAAMLFPIHEASLGRKFSGAESFKGIDVPPLTYALGPGGHLFRNHHNVADVFTSVKFGRATVGKSVDEVYEDLMWLARYPDGGALVIDRGPSAYQLCRMLDGQYYRVLGANSPGFALFWDAHIPAQRREIFKIIKHMVELSGVEVNGDREKWVKEGIRLQGTRPRPDRSFFDFWESLQDNDDSLRKVLKKYTRLGDVGVTFDCSTDSFETGRYNVIDLEQAMNLTPDLLIPLLEIIFWKTKINVQRAKEALGVDGDHAMFRIRVDEVNNSLMRHPIGVRFLVDAALMWRKDNIALALASNGLVAFTDCPGSSDIIDAMATIVYFNDPAAGGKNRKIYEGHECPERAIAWIKELADREFVKLQKGANICKRLTHALDKPLLAIIGNSRNVRVVDDYIGRYPVGPHGLHGWKVAMLRAQGADEAAEMLENILESLELDEQSAAAVS